MALARKAMRKGDLTSAKKHLATARRYAKRETSTQQNDVKKLAEDFNKIGEGLVREADEAFDKRDFLTSIKMYKRVRTVMEGLPSGKSAAQKLKWALDTPAVQAALAEDRARTAYGKVSVLIGNQWKNICKKAKKADPKAPSLERPADGKIVAKMPVRRQADILDKLEFIAKTFADTATGKKGGELLAELKADKKMLASIERWRAEIKVKQAFAKAQRYERAKMYDKAVRYYQEFIDKYPESEYARKAKIQLAAVKKMNK